MKKYLFIAAAICVFVSSCAKNDSASIEIKNEPSSNPYAELSAQIESLNQDYLVPETRAKWWKFLITAVADAGVGLATGNVGYAISASSLTWTVLKDVNGKSDSSSSSTSSSSTSSSSTSSSSTSSSTSPATGEFIKPSIKEVETSLVYLDVCDGSVNDGEIHNTVINNIYNRYGEEMFELESEELLTLVATEVAYLTNSTSSSVIADIDKAVSDMSVYTSAYLRSNSVNDYITELKIIHPNKSEELDVLKVSLEGFQYIDPETDNGQYAKSVVTLIEDSNINPDSKNALISGVSVANASVRLWNEDAINSL